MVEFTIQGIVRSEQGSILIKGKKLFSIIIAHGEGNSHFLPVYFYGELEQRIRATEIKCGDQIMVEGELRSILLETKDKQGKINTYIRVIPIVRDYEYIARETTGREISLPILNKLLALEEIGGKIK